jgi:hypothetical protein
MSDVTASSIDQPSPTSSSFDPTQNIVIQQGFQKQH